MYASVNKILSRENDDAINGRKKVEFARREFYETFLLERDAQLFSFDEKMSPTTPNFSSL